MLAHVINKWFSRFNKYLFTYKNGFFELPYLANSPQSMLESFIKMPFVKHSAKDKIIRVNNPFTNTVFYYEELEPGLMIFVSDVYFKSNVSFKHIYDKYLPIDYYFLTFHISNHSLNNKNPLVDGILYSNKSWSLFKPGRSVADCHFKGEKSLFLSVYFNEEWLQNYLSASSPLLHGELNKFLKSKLTYIIWPNLSESADYDCQPLLKAMTQKRESADKDKIKKLTLDFIEVFETKMNTEQINDNHFEIDNIQRIKILKVEKLLQKHLYSKFPGIKFLANEVDLSETNVKSIFKLVYGKSIFQYFQEKQMLCAYKILKEDKMRINELALQFGYENASKFSSAFKKHLGSVPSEI